MSSTWRESKGLSYEQVFQAVTALKCRKEGETDEFNICPQCSGKNIIEIGSTNRNSYHPTVSDDKTEMYVFDHCKTNCSSSRDHHRKKLQIVITLDDQKVVTIPFSIQAREKKSSKPKNQNITPHTVQSLVNETILLQQPQQHNTFPIQQFQNQQPNQQLPQQQRQNISDSAEKVIVFVFSTCLTPNDSNELIQNYRSYISKISGYINLRASFIDGLFFIFVYFINVSQTQEYISATRLYLNNEPPFINLYNKKLDSDNIAVLLSSFHNCHEQTQPNISYFNPTY
ncbi:Programmed cell death protein 2 C-terminal domain-containing protein [Entamoeba marina]